MHHARTTERERRVPPRRTLASAAARAAVVAVALAGLTVLGACSPGPAVEPVSVPTASATLEPVEAPAANDYAPGASDLSAVDVCGTANDQLTLAQSSSVDPAFIRWDLQPATSLTRLSSTAAVSGCTATLRSGDPGQSRADLVVALRSSRQFPTQASFVAAASTAATDPVTSPSLSVGAVTGRATVVTGGLARVATGDETSVTARYWVSPYTVLEASVHLTGAGPSEAQMREALDGLAERFASGPLPRTGRATPSVRDLAPVCLAATTPAVLRGTPGSSVTVRWTKSAGTGDCVWGFGSVASPATITVVVADSSGTLKATAAPASSTLTASLPPRVTTATYGAARTSLLAAVAGNVDGTPAA